MSSALKHTTRPTSPQPSCLDLQSHIRSHQFVPIVFLSLHTQRHQEKVFMLCCVQGTQQTTNAS